MTETRNKSCKYMAVAAVVAVVKKISNSKYPNQKKEKQRKLESQNI